MACAAYQTGDAHPSRHQQWQKPTLVRSLVAVVSSGVGASLGQPQSLAKGARVVCGAQGRLAVYFTPLYPTNDGARPPDSGHVTFLLGDDAEWSDSTSSAAMGSATTIHVDLESGALRVISSIVGLPAVFLYSSDSGVAVASNPALMVAARLLDTPTIEPRSAYELFTIGYPLEHRTIFEGVSIIPGGHVLDVDPRGRFALREGWHPTCHPEVTTWDDHVNRQLEAFRGAARRISVSRSVLSLTGGLDTRAILAVLIEQGLSVSACTVTGGTRLSLDARAARDLCRSYSIPHHVIGLGDDFLRDLPRLVRVASRLSGGLASLEQSHEVYFHEQLSSQFERRLSGFLGNQVGRLGVEGLSMRAARTSVLNSSLQSSARTAGCEHWLTRLARESQRSLPRLLVQQECLASSVGNMGIGAHYLVQQSPYASRELIEASMCPPCGADQGVAFSPRTARLRDLRHRLVGPSRRRSFQRRLIVEAGGPVSTTAVNWGWKPKGGLSLSGLLWGLGALIDAASTPFVQDRARLRQGLERVGIRGIHHARPYEVWLNSALGDFVNDTLRASRVRESGLFDNRVLCRHLDEHFGGVTSHYDTIVAALDLALVLDWCGESLEPELHSPPPA